MHGGGQTPKATSAPTTSTPVCGVGGFTNCSEADLQVCDPIKEGEHWYGRSRLFMRDNKDTKESEPVFVGKGEKPPEGSRQPRSEPAPRPKIPGGKDPEPSISEWQGVIASGWLEQYGLRGMCRSANAPYRFFGYKAQGLAEYLANFNEKPDGMVRSPFDIALDPAEVQALASYAPLHIKEEDIAIAPGLTAKDTGDGTAIYHFTKDPNRLGQIIAVLENPAVQLGIQKERRTWIVTQLKQLTKPSDLQITNLEKSPDQWWKSVIGQLGGSTPFQLAFMYLLYRQLRLTTESLGYMRQQMDGDMPKNRFEEFGSDYVQETREKLAEDIFANETIGRDQEALDYLKRLTRDRYANPMVLAESGVGKDEVIKRACQLVALRDPRVPIEFYDGTIKGIMRVNPIAFGANTYGRGDSDARNRELQRVMDEGYAIYFEEIADKLTAGVADKSVSESLASALKVMLTQDSAKFSTTTTPASFNMLVRETPWLRDIERRLPKLIISDLPVSELEFILPRTLVPRHEDKYSVEIEPGAVKAAINLGLKYRLPQGSHARYDAINGLLTETIERLDQQRANPGDVVKVTARDVANTVSTGLGHAVDPAEVFPETLPHAVRTEPNLSYAEHFQKQLQDADPWFAALPTREQRALVRKAVRWQLVPEDAPRGVVARDGRLNTAEAMQEVREIHSREQVRRAVEADPHFQALQPERRIAINRYIDEHLTNRGDATRLLQDAAFRIAPANHVWQRVESRGGAEAINGVARAADASRAASAARASRTWADASRDVWRAFRGK